MRCDFTLQALRLGAALGDLQVDLVQSLSFFRQRRFAIVDPGASFLFGLAQPIDLALTVFQPGLERLELLSGIMSVEHTQISMQRLISSRLARLPLQRADLSLDIFAPCPPARSEDTTA